MESTFLSKLLMKTGNDADPEQKHFLYVESKWLEHSLELHLHTSDSNKTYKGELSAEHFGQCANELDIPFDDFYSACKDALTANITLPPFEYVLAEDELIFRLTKKEKFEIVYLEVPLKELNNNIAMLDAAVNIFHNLREARNEELKLAKKDDSTAKELLHELNNCVKEKENMEKKLLGKFLMLLNSKKAKINELKEQLLERNPEAANQNSEDDFEALTQQEV